MLALAAVGLGIVLGVAAGGSIRAIRGIRMRGDAVILLLFVAQALVRGPLFEQFGEFAIVLWGACSLVLLVLMVANGRVVGTSIIGAGIAANLLVVQLNRGMPVVPPPGLSDADLHASIDRAQGFYLAADARTFVPALGDVLPTGNGMASLGDLLLVLGVMLIITSHMCEPKTPD